jgi:phosphoribosylanthranilate isomerase
MAAQEGADLIGIILSKCSKRFVETERAKEIALAAKREGSIPVAVFVEGHPEHVHSTCRRIGVNAIQLHGAEAKRHVVVLSDAYTCFYAVSVSPEGVIQDPSLEQAGQHADYLLFDNGRGGTGSPFCWELFQPPEGVDWFLAGGITPENVQRALKLKPKGIDIASGVERPGTIRKDHRLVKQLIQRVREADETG